MVHIFINNTSNTLAETAQQIFRALGLEIGQSVGSLNVLGGKYWNASAFGVNVKVELNSYDFEDAFNIMVTVSEDVLATLAISAVVVDMLAEHIAALIAFSFQTKTYLENPDGSLRAFMPYHTELA